MGNAVRCSILIFLYKVTFMLLWLRRMQLPSFEICILFLKIATDRRSSLYILKSYSFKVRQNVYTNGGERNKEKIF